MLSALPWSSTRGTRQESRDQPPTRLKGIKENHTDYKAFHTVEKKKKSVAHQYFKLPQHRLYSEKANIKLFTTLPGFIHSTPLHLGFLLSISCCASSKGTKPGMGITSCLDSPRRPSKRLEGMSATKDVEAPRLGQTVGLQPVDSSLSRDRSFNYLV